MNNEVHKWPIKSLVFKSSARPGWRNRPRSIYQYSNMVPRLSGQTSIFGVVFFVSKSPLGIERQKKLEKFAILTRKPRSHARILIYRTWPIMAQFFLDCVIIKIWGLARAQNWEESSESVKFKTSFTQIFSCILLTGNHTVFLVQFGINLHLWVFQKAKLHSPKRLVQFQLFEKLTRAN